MLSQKVKDIKHRVLFRKYEKKRCYRRFFFIYFLNKLKISKKKKLVFLYLFLKKNKIKFKNKTKNKIVRRCAISFRGRGSFRPYNFSRFFLRQYMQFGLIPGSKKGV